MVLTATLVWSCLLCPHCKSHLLSVYSDTYELHIELITVKYKQIKGFVICAHAGISLKSKRSTWTPRTTTARCLQRRMTSKVQTPTTMQNTQMITAQPVCQLYPEILADLQPLDDPVYQQTLTHENERSDSLFIISFYLFLLYAMD